MTNLKCLYDLQCSVQAAGTNTCKIFGNSRKSAQPSNRAHFANNQKAKGERVRGSVWSVTSISHETISRTYTFEATIS